MNLFYYRAILNGCIALAMEQKYFDHQEVIDKLQESSIEVTRPVCISYLTELALSTNLKARIVDDEVVYCLSDRVSDNVGRESSEKR